MQLMSVICSKYLIDLTTTAHVFLKMLSNYCEKNKRSVVVQQVKNRRQRNKKNKKSKGAMFYLG